MTPVVIPGRILERIRTWPQGKPDECWPWPLSTASHGYGQIGWYVSGRKNAVGTTGQRVSWTAFNGPIPEGMTVDHLCRNRVCWNPAHLRLLSNSENASDNGFASRRFCPRGHEYAGDNLYQGPTGGRRCRACAKIVKRAWARKKAS